MKALYELNKTLLDAAENHQFEKIESLLQHGADPLGSSNENNPNEHILEKLFCYATYNSILAEKLPQLIVLFYAYGMDLKRCSASSGGRAGLHPLWSLAFCQNESGLKILEVLLDHNLDHASAEELISHIFMDMEMCDGCMIEDAWLLESITYGLKMVMLVASYPHITQASDYIRECIEIDNNNFEILAGFRNPDNFAYHIDLSTCTNIPHGLLNATLTIRNVLTNEAVWTLQI